MSRDKFRDHPMMNFNATKFTFAGFFGLSHRNFFVILERKNQRGFCFKIQKVLLSSKCAQKALTKIIEFNFE